MTDFHTLPYYVKPERGSSIGRSLPAKAMTPGIPPALSKQYHLLYIKRKMTKLKSEEMQLYKYQRDVIGLLITLNV